MVVSGCGARSKGRHEPDDDGKVGLEWSERISQLKKNQTRRENSLRRVSEEEGAAAIMNPIDNGITVLIARYE